MIRVYIWSAIFALACLVLLQWAQVAKLEQLTMETAETVKGRDFSDISKVQGIWALERRYFLEVWGCDPDMPMPITEIPECLK